MKLRPGQHVAVYGLPGVWAIAYRHEGTSQWVIVPISTTKGLAMLCKLGIMEASRRDLTPLSNQETLL